MKIGFNLLLWTGHVGHEHRPLLRDIRKAGYDGIEVPVFQGDPDHYARLGEMLDEIGLERTAVA
ncbi:MAG TPA: sugar phosphate isomerase/epimerase, partial [Nordella sp.]|nr:sugar phosphate isomerase/epimerase [Nordella sp.]